MPRDPRTRPLLAARIQSELFSILGTACVECGSTDRVQFDHPYGRTYESRKLSHYNRLLRYKKDLAEGNLRVLCLNCNETIRPKRGPRVTRQDVTSENPF